MGGAGGGAWSQGCWVGGLCRNQVRGDEGLATSMTEELGRCRGRTGRIWGLSQRWEREEEVEMRLSDGGAVHWDGDMGAGGVGVEMESLVWDGVNALNVCVSPRFRC